jgi:hypothetical protein
MSSLSKGERLCIKLIDLFINQVVKRRNMINNYLRGELVLSLLWGV